MVELLGVDRLRSKLAQKRTRVLLRYKYYEMKAAVRAFNVAIPEKWSYLSEALGWCARAADSVADRLVFRSFSEDVFAMNEILNQNSRDVLLDSAVLGSVIASCSFIYISRGEDGFPRLQVLDASDATGVMDPITRMLFEGYAVLERHPDTHVPVLEAYFEPGRTTFYPAGGSAYSIKNPAPYPLLVPIVHRPDAVREFGHSRISRACMDIQQAAMRTLQRSEVSAEFYSFPQKYVTGMSQDAEPMDKWKATISSFLQMTRDEEGNAPQFGQFQQQSMAPFAEQLRMLAGLFAGETGLTLDDLGFPSVNPSSAESIKASHETLRLAARKAQRTIGTGLLNAGYLAACVRDDYPYLRRQVYMTKAEWEPLFEPDAAAIGLIGDAAVKVNQAVPGYFGEENLRKLTGVEADGSV